MTTPNLPQTKRLPAHRLIILCLLLLVLGVVFRFTHLDRQVYWHDETYTSLRISGYSAIEVNQSLFNGDVVGIEDLQQYQRPNADRPVWDTVRSLAIEDAQHPPLYYVLVRLWTEALGTSVATIRSLSALIGVFIFPSMYWLCRELFAHPVVHHARNQSNRSNRSPQSTSSHSRSTPFSALGTWVASVAIALIAISPFQVLYAQEAREYGLWAVWILLSSAALLRALRLNRWQSWVLYGILTTLGLYTHPLMLFVAIGHGLYVLAMERRFSRTLVAYLLSFFGIAFSLFFPWFAITAASWSRTGATWTSIPLPLDVLLKTWGLHLNRAFLLTIGDYGFDHWLTYVSLPLVLILVIYAFYVLYRQTSARIWVFVFSLTGSVAVPLMLADLILGGQRSVSSRYLMPAYLGVQLAVAYLLATKLLSGDRVRRSMWQGIAAIVFAVGVAACVINAQSETAWTKGINYNMPTVARIINASPQPLVVSHSGNINFGSIFSLSYLVNPNTQFQLVDGSHNQETENLPQIPPGFSDVFLLNPSDPFRQQLEQQQGTSTELVFNDTHLYLWKMQ